MRTRAVVAGGAGFIGYHLVKRLLAEDFDVVIIDNFATGSHRNVHELLKEDRCELIEHDICEPFEVPGPVEFVINLACPASPVDFDRIPIEIMCTNAQGTYNLLELALHKGAVFVQASTSEIYGDPETHPQSEDYTGNVNITGPRAVYDEGKRFAEALAFAYQRKYRVPVRVARIFNTYGPRMRPDDGRVVPNFCMQALQNKPLTVYGTGEQTRSFCYVDDLVEGLWRLMHSEHSGPFNLGNPSEITIKQLAETIIELTGSTAGITYKPLLHRDDPRRRCPDIRRARELLGWEPKVPLREGLEKTLEWFKEVLQRERQAAGE